MLSFRVGMIKDRDQVIDELTDIQYVRNDMDFHRGTFRVRGDVLEILPVSTFDDAVRVEFFGDEIDSISEFDPFTGEIRRSLNFTCMFPASHYVSDRRSWNVHLRGSRRNWLNGYRYFKSKDKLIEAQRIEEELILI